MALSRTQVRALADADWYLIEPFVVEALRCPAAEQAVTNGFPGRNRGASQA